MRCLYFWDDVKVRHGYLRHVTHIKRWRYLKSKHPILWGLASLVGVIGLLVLLALAAAYMRVVF